MSSSIARRIKVWRFFCGRVRHNSRAFRRDHGNATVQLKKATTKDIWPWVYLTRMIGVSEADANAATRMFHTSGDFRGLDLENKAGARERLSGQLAERLSLSAPETRTFRGETSAISSFTIIWLSVRSHVELRAHDGTLDARNADALEGNLGARMADAAASEYPGATLWFLFTRIYPARLSR